MHNLLMLSGGSLVGHNVLSSLSLRRENCHLTVLNSKEDDPDIFDYDTAYLVPSLVENRKEFEKRFHEIFVLENPDLIIPCRDEDVFFLSELTEKRPELSSKLLCGSFNVADAFLDKGKSWLFSKSLDLPFAPTIYTDANPALIASFIDEHGFPVIAKPTKGFASHGIKLIYSKKQLLALIGRSGYVLQKYLGDSKKIKLYIQQSSDEGLPLFHSFEETKISIQASVGPNGEIGGVFITRHRMSQGKSDSVEIYEDNETYNLGLHWVAKIVFAGWRGPINIQCQHDQSGKLTIYEYNGRFTGATSGRNFLGFDEVGIILNLWLGDGFPVSGICNGNKIVKRIPESKVVDLCKVKQLLEHGVWKSNK